MLARKCDRCGKLYELPFTPNLRVSLYRHPCGDTVYDLCPECLETLDKWLNEFNDRKKEADYGYDDPRR